MKNKILGLLATGLLAQSATVSAATVTYNFFVNGGDLGPLAGVSASGFLSFDDPDSWLISLGLGSEFAYDAGDDGRLFFGPVRISLLRVPEPGTLALLGLGVIALALGRHLKGR